MSVRPIAADARGGASLNATATVIAGGGPAGLTAAFELAKNGMAPLVLEKDALVGGISRTEVYKGYGFDMGGHRFFTKSPEVDAIWREIMGDDFLRRPRLSRIYYNKKFYNYPLKPLNALRNLGWYESAWLIASYCRWKVKPHKQEETFEEWVVNRFGRRLFRTFFKTYTEKVWGISTHELRADWAAGRIKNLSLRQAVMGGVWKPRHGKITTLIEEFDYPRRGPGMLWEKCAGLIEQKGGEVRRNTAISAVHRDGFRITGVDIRNADGETETLPCDRLISSMPLTLLVRLMQPQVPAEVLEAAMSLKYRDFLTVCLIVDEPNMFPDNWIYVHDPAVQVGRIQNFKNWSPEMIPEADRDRRTSLGLEYFCNEGDELWSLPDEELVRLATRELVEIELCRANKVVDGVVFRVPKSYPVYDAQYARHVQTIRSFVDQLENCHTVGRNGLHRYNNQDHSMLTGLYAAREIMGGEKVDLWQVNADQEYHEEKRGPGRNAGTVRPRPAASEDVPLETSS